MHTHVQKAPELPTIDEYAQSLLERIDAGRPP
jgi:hypothetical protein